MTGVQTCLFRSFFGSHTDSTLFRYSHGFDFFLVLFRILPFFSTHKDSTLFRYSSVLIFDTRTILPIPGTRLDSTIFRYSHWFDPFPVFVVTIFRYSHGIYFFPVPAQILPFIGTHTNSNFSGIRWDKFSIIARNLPFAGTRPDSTIFRYTH